MPDSAMVEFAKGLYGFFSNFGLPAYVEYSVPDDADVSLPYITYELIRPDWKSNGQVLTARIWYRSTSFSAVLDKVDQIRQAIGNGISIKLSNGAVHLWADEAWAQAVPNDEPDIKCIRLGFIIQANFY